MEEAAVLPIFVDPAAGAHRGGVEEEVSRRVGHPGPGQGAAGPIVSAVPARWGYRPQTR